MAGCVFRAGGRVNFRLRHMDHCSGDLFIRWGLQVLVFSLVSFPIVTVGQENVPQIQINTAADDFPQPSSAAFEEGRAALSVAVMRMSEVGAAPRLWNVDMGGVNPFRLPKPPIHSFRAISPAALIGPVWNHGIAEQPDEAYGFGGQFWELQGMANRAQNSITILEGNSKDIEISIGQQPTSDVTVVITGHAGTDLTVSPSTFTFSSSDWADQTATLTAGHDDDAVSDELVLTIISTQGSNESSVERAVTIVDDEIIWELTPRVMEEGQGIGVQIFLLESLGPPSEDVTFTVTGHEGTSLAPDPTTLIFPVDDWQGIQWLDLSAKQDEDNEDERVTLTFTAAGGGYDGLTYSMDVTIKDRPPLELLIPEGRSYFFQGYHLLLSGRAPPQSDIVGTYTGYQGTDLSVFPSSVIYTAGSWFGPCRDGSGQVWDYCSRGEESEFAAAHDPDDEDDQIRLIFEVPDFGVEGQIHVRIEDDDAVSIPLVRISATPTEVNEGEFVTVTVTLSEALSAALSVPLEYVRSGDSATESTDYHGPAQVTIPQTETSGSGQISIENDDVTEDDEVFTVSLGRLPSEVVAGSPHSVEITILENDPSGIELVPSLLNVTEGSAETYSVRLLSEPVEPVTINIVESGGNVIVSPLVLHFAASNWNELQQVTVRADLDDNSISESSVLIHTATSVDPGYSGKTAILPVTVIDQDVPHLVVDPGVLTMDEGTSAEFTVKLASEPTVPVAVQIPVFTNPDLTHDQPSLTFTTSTWDEPQVVTVSAAADDDAEDEAPETLTLRASGGEYNGVAGEVTVTVKDKGEVLLSIYDAQVLEGDGSVDLRVELSHPADQLVSVMYRAEAEDAEAGSDYEDSRGIVLFAPGSTKGKIRLDILEDEIPESDETFTVVLSNARNAVIARETGRVTIVDNDAASRVWIDDGVASEEDGRIQFTVHLSQPSESPVAVSYRTENGTATAGEDYEAASGVLTFAPGVVQEEIAVELLTDELDWRQETFTVHLQSLGKTRIEKAVAVATIREKTPMRSGVLKAYTARFVRTSTVQIVEALHQRFRSRTDATSCSAAQRVVMAQVWGATTGWDPSPGELLAGCHVSREMGGLSAWGRGAFTRFNGHGEDALRIRADVTTAMVGTDYRWRQGWLAGLLVSHSQGDGSFDVYEASGAVQSGLTGVVPYVSVQGADWGAWMAVGYGRGQTEVEELEGDLASTFGAAGVQGEWASNAAFGLTVHGDVLVAGAEVDAHAVRAQVYRMRAGLGGDLRISDVIRPYVEANVRQDGGSAETGTGLELGGGVRLSYPAWRLKGEMRTQGLVIHSADGFSEWGLSGLVQVGNGPEGLVMSVRPSWGPQQGGVLQRQHLDVTPAGGNLHRTAMEMAYGVPLKAGIIRSVAGVTQLSTGRMYRLGTELRPRDYVNVSVYGMAYTHAHAPSGIGLNLQGSVRY